MIQAFYSETPNTSDGPTISGHRRRAAGPGGRSLRIQDDAGQRDARDCVLSRQLSACARAVGRVGAASHTTPLRLVYSPPHRGNARSAFPRNGAVVLRIHLSSTHICASPRAIAAAARASTVSFKVKPTKCYRRRNDGTTTQRQRCLHGLDRP